VNNEELAYGLRSLAVPVRGKSGEVVAGINLAVHRSAASIEDLVERLGPKLKRTAEEISARIGY
jgi:IclR family transcriptional regulator, pca regulon regulatory protein